MAAKIEFKQRKFIKIFKFQLILTGFFILSYIIFGLSIGWERLLSDIGQKGRVAGTTVAAMVRVFGPPDPPFLAGSAGCDAFEQPYAYLFWNEEDDATSYEIYRDGEELITGLSDIFYTDGSVDNATQYSYIVTAVGPMGTADSNLVFLTTQQCSENIIPQVSITTFKGKNISSYHGTPSTTDRKPSFSGSTDISNANINIEIHGGRDIYASTSANINGSWQWTSPVNLSRETQVIYITAIDPNNPSVTAETSLVFKIKKEEDDDDEEDEEESGEDSEEIVSSPNIPIPTFREDEAEFLEENEKPFDFQIELKGTEYVRGVKISEEVYLGENLSTKITFTSDAEKFGQAEIVYVLSDEEGFYQEFEDEINFGNGLFFEKDIPLSQKLKTGRYKLQISATVGDVSVSREGYFILKDRPVLKFGTGAILTYADILENLGWLVFFSLWLLIILAILSMWEHHLAKMAVFQVTENFLKKRGFIN